MALLRTGEYKVSDALSLVVTTVLTSKAPQRHQFLYEIPPLGGVEFVSKMVPVLVFSSFDTLCATLGAVLLTFSLVSYVLKQRILLSEACTLWFFLHLYPHRSSYKMQ